MKKLTIAASFQQYCVAFVCTLAVLLTSVTAVIATTAITTSSAQASESVQGSTVFVPIAVGDITTFIPIMPSSSTSSVIATSTDGSYNLSWSAVSNASYYQVIITDETGEQRIIKVLGTSYDLAGLSLGSNKVEVQACNASNQCGVGSYAGTVARSTKVTYKHTDMLGTPVMESDEAGNIASRSVYDPFGKRLGGEKAGIGYTGHLQDEDLGLTYMQARYYDPMIGRFYSNDPVGSIEHLIGVQGIQGFNRYSYVNNNPYKYTDPDGKNAYGPLGTYIGARLSGKTHEEAVKMMSIAVDTNLTLAKESVSFTKGGTLVDIVEVSYEVMIEQDIKDNVAGMTAGAIAGEIAENFVEKKLGKEGTEIVSNVVGKFAGDAAKAATGNEDETQKTNSSNTSGIIIRICSGAGSGQGCND